MCKGLCIKGNETVSIPLVAGTDSYNLPSNMVAAGKHIKGINVRRNLNGAKDINKKSLAADTVISTAHLSVYQTGSTRCLRNLPLDYLTYDNSLLGCVDIENFDPNQSTIELDSSATGFAAAQVIELTFFYDCGLNCAV